MEDQKPPYKPKGRAPDHVHRLHIARLESLIVEGYTPEQCADIMIEEGHTESVRTVEGWRSEVFARWAKEEVELRPARRDIMRNRLDMLFRTNLQASLDIDGKPLRTMAASLARSECTKLAKLSCMLDGLLAPMVVKVDDAVDPLAMSPAERRAEIDELLQKREAAMRAAAERDGN